MKISLTTVFDLQKRPNYYRSSTISNFCFVLYHLPRLYLQHTPEPVGQEVEDDEEFGDFALARNLQSQFQKVSTPSLVTAQSQLIHKPSQLHVVDVPIPAVVPPPPPPAGPSVIATTVKHPDNGISLQNKPVNGS